MTEWFQGAIVGGSIGLAGSLIVESIRACYQRKERAIECRRDELKKMKGIYLELSRHFYEYQLAAFEFKSKKIEFIDYKDLWEKFTGYAPHLPFLPDHVAKLINDTMDDLYVRVINPVPLGANIKKGKQFSECFSAVFVGIGKIRLLFRSEIALIDAELMNIDGWFKKRFKKIANKLNKKPSKDGK